MRLSTELLRSENAEYKTARALHLDCRRLSDVKELAACKNLEYLSVKCNCLSSIESLTACQSLWVLNLHQNQLTSLRPLSFLKVIGFLDVTSNRLTRNSLAHLRQTHIIHLELNTRKLARREIISLLPRVWALNGKYISRKERESVCSLPYAEEQMTSFITGRKRVQDFILKFENNRISPDAKEALKFEYLIHDLEYCCELEWEVKLLKKHLKYSIFPKFQLSRWVGLRQCSRETLAVCIDLFLEGVVPGALVSAVLETLAKEEFQDSSSLIEVNEIAKLRPAYLLSFLIHLKALSPPAEREASTWGSLNIAFLLNSFYSVQGLYLDDSRPTNDKGLASSQEEVLTNRRVLSKHLLDFVNANRLHTARTRPHEGLVIAGLLANLDLDYSMYLKLTTEAVALEEDSEDSSQRIVNSYSRYLQNILVLSRNYSVKDKTSLSPINESKTHTLELSKNRSHAQFKSVKTQFSSTQKEKLPPIIGKASSLQSRTDSRASKPQKSPSSSSQRKPTVEPPRHSVSQVYTADDSNEPDFILAGKSQFEFLTQNSPVEWKSIMEPPVLYLMDSNHSERPPSIFKCPTVPVFPAHFRSQSEASGTLSSRPQTTVPQYEEMQISLLEPQEENKEGTFLTSINVQIAQHPQPERHLSESPYSGFDTPLSFYSAGNSRQNWYPVTKKVRFIANEDFARNLRPCNFREAHKDLLPALPQRRVKKPKILLTGKALGPPLRSREIVRDSAHLQRVLNREGTPWVNYTLKPKFKLKQDPFCVNYSVLMNTQPRALSETRAPLPLERCVIKELPYESYDKATDMGFNSQ